MPMLKEVLEQKETILMAGKAWGLSSIMLIRGAQNRLNLLVEKAENATKVEEDDDAEMGFLENYLSRTLDCEVSIEVDYDHLTPTSEKLPLDATTKQLASFYGLAPHQLSLKQPNWSHFDQITYETICRKVADYRDSLAETGRRFCR